MYKSYIIKNEMKILQVAALLSPDHAVGETLLLNLLALNSSEVPLQSYSLALHALALLIIERADTKLITEVMNRVCTLKTSSSLLHVFCSDLNQLKQIGLRDKLAAILEQALDFVCSSIFLIYGNIVIGCSFVGFYMYS